MPAKQETVDHDILIQGRITATEGVSSPELDGLATRIEESRVFVQQVRADQAEIAAGIDPYINNTPPSNNITNLQLIAEPNADGSLNVNLAWDYSQGEIKADGFIVFYKSEPATPAAIDMAVDPAVFVAADETSTAYAHTLPAISARYGGAGAIPRHYRFAVVAVGTRAYGTIPHNAGVVENTDAVPAPGSGTWIDAQFAPKIDNVAIRSYTGQGVNRRAIEIDAESIDFIDAPDTDPATAELLQARIRRLGVGGAVLLDGNFYAPSAQEWSAAAALISGAGTNSGPAVIILANGYRRAAVSTSARKMVEVIHNSTTWGAQFDAFTDGSAEYSYPSYTQRLSGLVYMAYVKSGVIRVRSLASPGDGTSWSAEVSTGISGSKPSIAETKTIYDEEAFGYLRIAYIQTSDSHPWVAVYDEEVDQWVPIVEVAGDPCSCVKLFLQKDGTTRIAYKNTTSGALEEKIDTGTGFGATITIDAAGGLNPEYIEDVNGDLWIQYYDESGSGDLVQRKRTTSWGSPIQLFDNIYSVLGGSYPVRLYFDLDGSINVIGCQDTTMVEFRLSRYARIGAGIVERGVDGSANEYADLGDGTRLYLEQMTGQPSATPLSTMTVQSFLTSGSKTWTKPAGCKRIIVAALAAGGGGGDGDSTHAGGAGGSGARATLAREVGDVASIDFTIGAAGQGGGATQSGTAGGNIVFDGWTISGGGGGQRGGVGSGGGGAGTVSGSSAKTIVKSSSSGKAGGNGNTAGSTGSGGSGATPFTSGTNGALTVTTAAPSDLYTSLMSMLDNILIKISGGTGGAPAIAGGNASGFGCGGGGGGATSNAGGNGSGGAVWIFEFY